MSGNSPLRIGITGGIGAGKSLCCRIFQLLGIAVYDADSRAKYLMSHDELLKRQIKDFFGTQAYDGDQLNRAWISKKVFGDNELLNHLNELVHPAVGVDFEHWVKQQTSPYVLKEAALLFESGSYMLLDQMITVTAPEKLRIQRVLVRDPHRSETEIKVIIVKQWSETQKADKSNYVINNSGENLVIPQIMEIHQSILEQIRR